MPAMLNGDAPLFPRLEDAIVYLFTHVEKRGNREISHQPIIPIYQCVPSTQLRQPWQIGLGWKMASPGMLTANKWQLEA